MDIREVGETTFAWGESVVLDRLYVTAIDGPLLVIDGVGVTGRPEPRARLSR